MKFLASTVQNVWSMSIIMSFQGRSKIKDSVLRSKNQQNPSDLVANYIPNP